MKHKYIVYVDDNFHFMDKSERLKDSEHATLKSAIERCDQIIFESIQHCYEPGMTCDELHQQYLDFGESPFIPGHAYIDNKIIKESCEYFMFMSKQANKAFLAKLHPGESFSDFAKRIVCHIEPSDIDRNE